MTRHYASCLLLLLCTTGAVPVHAGFDVFPGVDWTTGHFTLTQNGITLTGPRRCSDIRPHTAADEADTRVLSIACKRAPAGRVWAVAGFRYGQYDGFSTTIEIAYGDAVLADGPLGPNAAARLPGAWALDRYDWPSTAFEYRGCPAPWAGAVCGPRAGILAVSDGTTYYYARSQAVVHAIPTTPTAGCRITVPDLAIRASPGTQTHGTTIGALTCSTARRVRLYASGGAGTNVVRFGSGGLLARLTIDEVDSMATPVYVDVKAGAMQNVTVGADVDVGAATPGGDYIGTAILMIEEP